MPSDTRNVKLGVCRVTFGGADLGYTKGGVEVTVTTETHKVTVDQFGSSEVAETIQGRTVKVKVPMAETTLENMVRIMPGASLASDGAKASGIITFADQPIANDTVTIGDVVFIFKASALAANEIAIGATLAGTLANAAQVINASAVAVSASASATVLTVTADDEGVAGNGIALAKTCSAATVTGGALSGGIDATKKRVDVTTGIGVNLLDLAKPLVLHPSGNADGDLCEDFVIPKAATPGAITYAYKVDQERIFNVEFSGYPDPTSKKLFHVGDAAA